jgi:hypothetical protein
MRKRFDGLFLLLILSCFRVSAQSAAENLADSVAGTLAAKGFENIRVNHVHDTLFIGLENRVWRYEPRGASEALALVMPLTDSQTVVSLTLMHTGIPITTLVVSRKHWDDLAAGKIPSAASGDSVAAFLSHRGYQRHLKQVRPVNRSFFKFDVAVIPQLKLQFGDYVHPLEAQFNIAPAVQISFLPGMSFTGQVIFPVFNNLEGDPEGNTIRPGLVALSQTFRLPHQIFTRVTAGYFTRNRYGVNGEVRKFFFNGKMAAGGSVGYTGQVQLLDGYFTYGPVNLFTWFCDASWRFARYDLTIKGGYGGFIGGDHGWRADVSRQFGEVSIGFFAMQTDGFTNGGFNFIVPLPPRKYGTKNRIRLRPASYVPWEYRAKGLPSYGRTFSAGATLEETMRDLLPDRAGEAVPRP